MKTALVLMIAFAQPLALSLCSFAAETGTLDEPLEPLRRFIGKTWRGEFKSSTPEKPVIDIARWERALNGKAIRVLHSINEGSYGGESILRWDPEKKQLIYFYFTTAGFYTTGAMTIHDRKITSTEKVTGSAEGTTEVRTSYELRSDGSMLNKAEYLKKDVVTGTREVLYKEAPDAKVVFK
jgi:hypothetical protein